MSDRDKLRKVFDEIGIKYEMTDDNYEYSTDEIDSLIDEHGTIPDFALTAVEVADTDDVCRGPAIFLFTRDGKFKEVIIF